MAIEQQPLSVLSPAEEEIELEIIDQPEEETEVFIQPDGTVVMGSDMPDPVTTKFGEKVQENTEKTDKLKKKIEETKTETGKLNDAFAKIGDTLATGVSDALVGVVNGTRSLADAARSLLSDIANQFLRLGINTLLFSAFGGESGLFKNLPTFAAGGRPPVGRPSIVGERGPELFVPSTAGTIIPNDKMGGVTNNIVVNVDVDGGASVDADENNSKQFGLALAAAIQSEIINQKRAGGLLA